MQRTHAINDYLDSIEPDPSKRFLFLNDPNDLTKEIDALRFHGVERDLLRYGNALSLRDALEELKEADLAGLDVPAAMVVVGSESPALTPVADLLARSLSVDVTPFLLLRRFRPEQRWIEEINALRGNDFWNLTDQLIHVRKTWRTALTASNLPTLIAEARLDRTLRLKMNADEALELWESTERDEALSAFLARNPTVEEAVQGAIQKATSIEAKLKRDPEFSAFLWTTYFLNKYAANPELLLPQFFDPHTWAKYSVHDSDELEETCGRLIDTQPETVISQVRIAERAIASDPARERLFMNLLGLEGDKRIAVALRIASEETLSGYLTELCLRALIPHIAGKPTAISESRLTKLRRVLERRHLGALYPEYYPNLGDTVGLFGLLLELSERVEAFHAAGWERRLNELEIEEWMEELCPSLARMSLAWDELNGRRDQAARLLGDAPAELIAETQRILAMCDRKFARSVEANYIRWISRAAPPPTLTVDFLETVFLPEWRRAQDDWRYPLAVICLFHGLRWDEWEVVAPVFEERLSKRRHAGTRPIMSLLPTNRPYNTGAVILGRFPSLADAGTVGALLSERLAIEGIPFIGSVSAPKLRMPDARRGVLLANVSLTETGANKTRRTGDAKELIRKAAEETLGRFLEDIPPRALVVAVSNGGTCETTAPATKVESGAVEVQRRWVGLNSLSKQASLPREVSYFNSEAIHLPNPHVSRCAFAGPGVWFAKEEHEASMRFFSGGVSLSEMIVPCSVYRPRARHRPSKAPNEA